MPKIYRVPFANAGDKQSIPISMDPNGFVSDETGFTIRYELKDSDPSYLPIERAEFNGLMNDVTAALGEVQRFGFAKWQAGSWPKGARVVHNEVVYKATKATTNAPTHADWVKDQPDQVAIVQGVGQNTDRVMSQKAVSDQLNAKANSATTISAGTGLTGGGSLAANRSFAVKYGSTAGTAIQGNAIVQGVGQSTTQIMSQKAVSDQLNAKANNAITISAGAGLTGGGSLAANRSFAVKYGTAAGTAVQGNAIVQSTGQNTANIMSQKAVTDALGTAGVTGNKAANGYVKFGNGVILQWGKVYPVPSLSTNSGVDAGKTVQFPIAFPVTCTSVTIAPADGSVDRDSDMIIGFVTNANFKIAKHYDRASNAYWMATGY